ncbi:aminodeoxychorismate/anthranilate synthase component II [Brevibacillus laterosporus]|uniref:Aminodeoxychorismate/anthranilate synthase component II n=1 Tax=Brevibacillus laterosporus TaxID=1465 RepID=A0AAP3DKP6_BRELA|nr:aminodeoxychorismate/anthranilate synthase component II [Brevibacillus laterosporus]ATO49519.1 anthranilate/aminodeoxychorismate synthase component II [Brevibacillus laterosporus DSM 25]AYB40363.1 aminodeoxychorismate/anthranilate synthase component II [Brevibacillus laterosporus]MBG9802034.1 anthranilate synthase component II [Brevibacillus laterosporus]MBM7110834.1 Aminodeoxychorismate/anthranilate synthase component 2 [Brevibacillus laterosporus]MCR8981680.1 aminodeoxychorismate/anthrani
MIIMIDNYDSFTYNLVQFVGELGEELRVFRNDKITLEEIENMKPDYLMISPGPCTPNEAGISMDVVRHFAGKVPIFGVCLGHQSIGQVFGGKIVRADRLMHGKTSEVLHDGKTIFASIPSPFQAARYHSLVIQEESIPEEIEITARTPEGEIMAIRHRELPIEGVQFHPESIITQYGKQMLKNFLTAYAKEIQPIK